MSLRRSRILQTIDPTSSTMKKYGTQSKLPKSLPRPPPERKETETAVNDAPTTPDIDVDKNNSRDLQ